VRTSTRGKGHGPTREQPRTKRGHGLEEERGKTGQETSSRPRKPRGKKRTRGPPKHNQEQEEQKKELLAEKGERKHPRKYGNPHRAGRRQTPQVSAERAKRQRLEERKASLVSVVKMVETVGIHPKLGKTPPKGPSLGKKRTIDNQKKGMRT